MQTTAITVVSETNQIGALEDIAEHIEQECPYLCIDMTTAIEHRPGDYKDVVIPTVGPVLVTKRPLLGWPDSISRALRSRVWATLRILLTLFALVAVTSVLFLKDHLTEDQRTGFFFSGTIVQSILNFIEFSNYRGRIIIEVVKGFEFWYLTGVHTVCMVGMGYLYVAQGIEIWAVGTGLGLYVITFPITVFAIDGSFNSPRSRSITMILWLLAYSAFAAGCGMVTYFTSNTELIENFVNLQFDLFFVKLSPQSAVVACAGTLIVFFVKYAVQMWRGRMYVLLYFGIQTAKQEIGIISKVDDDNDVQLEGVGDGDSTENLFKPHGAAAATTTTGGGGDEPVEGNLPNKTSWDSSSFANDINQLQVEGQDSAKFSNIDGEGGHNNPTTPNPHTFDNTLPGDGAGGVAPIGGSMVGGFPQLRPSTVGGARPGTANSSHGLHRGQSTVKLLISKAGGDNGNHKKFTNDKVYKARARKRKSHLDRNPLAELTELRSNGSSVNTPRGGGAGAALPTATTKVLVECGPLGGNSSPPASFRDSSSMRLESVGTLSSATSNLQGSTVTKDHSTQLKDQEVRQRKKSTSMGDFPSAREETSYSSF